MKKLFRNGFIKLKPRFLKVRMCNNHLFSQYFILNEMKRHDGLIFFSFKTFLPCKINIAYSNVWRCVFISVFGNLSALYSHSRDSDKCHSSYRLYVSTVQWPLKCRGSHCDRRAAVNCNSETCEACCVSFIASRTVSGGRGNLVVEISPVLVTCRPSYGVHDLRNRTVCPILITSFITW